MKVKLKEVLKLLLLLFTFILIYSYLTIKIKNSYIQDISKIESEYKELDEKLLEYTYTHLETCEIDSINMYMELYINEDDFEVYKYIQKLSEDSILISNYINDLNNIKENKHKLISYKEDYILYHNRLISRFPSNIIIKSYQLITNNNK